MFPLKKVQVYPALEWIPVLQDGEVLAAGYPLDGRHFRSKSGPSPLMLFRGTHAEMRVPRSLPRELGPAILVGGSLSDYESLLMHVGGLAIVEATGVDRALPLVVGSDMTPFQRELLAWLGYGNNATISVDASCPIEFEQLHAPSRLVVGSKWFDPLLARWYRERAVAATPNAPARKLYVLSKHGMGAIVQNAEAVEAAAADWGFEMIDVSKLDVGEIVARFAGATHVVGATSDALSHLVFAPPGAAVYELRPAHWAESGGRMHFAQLCQACGHDYTAVECARAVRDDSEAVRVVVDVDAMRSLLESIA